MTGPTTLPVAEETALEIAGLTKRFGPVLAVDEIGLAVPVGSCYGVVGPNGAGKTTMLSMAVGLLRPDSGNIRLFGHDVWQDPVTAKSLVGVLPDGYALPGQFTGTELLHYLGALRGLERATVGERTTDLLAVLELDNAGGTIVGDYSAGMTKKIGLATAMLHNPRLLVLDEPFEAVDPVSAAAIRAILLRYVGTGGTVVISSHSMLLVEHLCTHVAVIDRGTVAAAGPVDEVRGGANLEDAFIRLVGARPMDTEAMPWLGH